MVSNMSSEQSANNGTLDLLQTAFPDLSRNNIEWLSQAAHLRTFPAAFDICREGDRGTSLYILDKGEVSIIVHAEDEQEILVDTLGPSRYFGEMAFWGETSRMATIRTVTECKVVEIHQDDFMAIAHTNPSLLRTLLRQIIGHSQRTDRAVIKELNIKNKVMIYSSSMRCTPKRRNRNLPICPIYW